MCCHQRLVGEELQGSVGESYGGWGDIEIVQMTETTLFQSKEEAPHALLLAALLVCTGFSSTRIRMGPISRLQPSFNGHQAAPKRRPSKRVPSSVVLRREAVFHAS